MELPEFIVNCIPISTIVKISPFIWRNWWDRPISSVQVWSWRVYSDLTSSKRDASMLLLIGILFLVERVLRLFEHRFSAYSDPFGRSYVVIAHVYSTCMAVFKDAKTGPDGVHIGRARWCS